MELADFGFDSNPIFPVPLAVAYRISHQQRRNQQSRYNSGQEQVADGGAGSHAVHDERNAGRDDNTQAAGNGHPRCSEGFIVAQPDENRGGHTAHGGNGCRSGSGNSTVKQAGHDDGARHSGGESSEEVSENVKDFTGDPALGHDDARQDEHGYRQERKAVQSAEHGSNQVLGPHGEGGVEDVRKYRCNPHRYCDDQEYHEQYEQNSYRHEDSFPVSTEDAD